MGIKLDWGDFDETVILMTISGNWTAGEFHTAIQDFTQRAYEADGDIELMVDLRQSLKPPQNIVTIVRAVLRQSLPNNVHQVVVISQTSFWERIYSAIKKLTGNHIPTSVYFVETVDEAYMKLDAFADEEFDMA